MLLNYCSGPSNSQTYTTDQVVPKQLPIPLNKLPCQIPRNPPPTVKDQTAWSQVYLDFISECLVKNYEERPTMSELAEHPLITVSNINIY